jgi:P pilus assembly chaperone PapD
MKKLISIFTILYAGAAFANITIYPQSIDLNADGKNRVQSVRITNTTQEKQTYSVTVFDFRQMQDGQIQELKENDKSSNSASQYVSVSPRQFSLDPKQTQTINVIRKPSAELSDGEYVSRLKIAEIDTKPKMTKSEATEGNTLGIDLRALYAVTIPVTITKGPLSAEAEISEAKKKDADTVTVTLSRAAGESSIFGNIVINDSGGRKIGEMNSLRIYPGNRKLTVNVKLNTPAEKPNVIFKNKSGKVSEKSV